MLIMLQDFTGSYLTPEERKREELMKKWKISDSLQWGWIFFKKHFASYKEGNSRKFVIINNLRPNVHELLKFEGHKVKRYTNPSTGHYYYIYL
ncbi:MAG: hypothetical protein E7311_02435 [Clostridiales bacterium]|nr:hypothetical protein [Clostridiales bacterium]